MDFQYIQDILETVVNITVIIAAVFAVIKFKLYEVLNPRYDTDMKVEQQYTKEGNICRVGREYYYSFPPSEPSVQVSKHSAQAISLFVMSFVVTV